MRTRARLLAVVSPWIALMICAAVACAAAPGSAESQIRRQIVAAAHEAAGAKSHVSRGVVALVADAKLYPLFRLEFRVEKGETLATEDRRFPAGRWTRQPTNEVVTVGEDIWWRGSANRYREGTVDPSLVDGTTGELIGLERAARAGRHLERLDTDRYMLTAPQRAFDREAARGGIRLEVTLTAAGRLHRLRRIEASGGAGAIVTETFDDFGRPLGITAPPPDAVVPGSSRHISDADELSELLGLGPFDDE